MRRWAIEFLFESSSILLHLCYSAVHTFHFFNPFVDRINGQRFSGSKIEKRFTELRIENKNEKKYL